MKTNIIVRSNDIDVTQDKGKTTISTSRLSLLYGDDYLNLLTINQNIQDEFHNDIVDTYAYIDQQYLVLANADSAMAQSILDMAADYQSADALLHAQITQEYTVYADANYALASEFNTLSATVDGLTVSLQETAAVANGQFTEWKSSDGVDATIGQYKFTSGIQFQYLGGFMGENADGWVRTDYNSQQQLDGVIPDLTEARSWIAGASSLIEDPDTGAITGWQYADGSGIVSQFKISADQILLEGTTEFYLPQNILPFKWSMFDSKDTPVFHTAAGVTAIVTNSPTYVDKLFAEYGLWVQSSSVLDGWCYFGTGYGDYNVPVPTGTNLIVSMYAKTFGGNNNVDLIVFRDDGTYKSASETLVQDEWTRVSLQIATNSSSAIQLRVDNDCYNGSPQSAAFCALQVEVARTGQILPSPFIKPSSFGGSTIIAGDQITTGTINANLVDVTNLDADNITAGSLSADFIAAGSISTSYIESTNFVEGTSGFKIDPYTPSVEFNTDVVSKNMVLASGTESVSLTFNRDPNSAGDYDEQPDTYFIEEYYDVLIDTGIAGTDITIDEENSLVCDAIVATGSSSFFGTPPSTGDAVFRGRIVPLGVERQTTQYVVGSSASQVTKVALRFRVFYPILLYSTTDRECTYLRVTGIDWALKRVI